METIETGRQDTIDVEARAKAIRATFSTAEKVLAAFSAPPAKVFKPAGFKAPTEQWNPDNALSSLCSSFPNLSELISSGDKDVLDYGCGDGFQSIALARAGARHVLGVDIKEQRLHHGRRMAEGLSNVSFSTKIEGTFDAIISLNSFEHFPNPEENLAEMVRALSPHGQIFISFGPPWLAPYGAHCHFFTLFPWVHLLFSEKTLFRVRSLYRDDGMQYYAPGLNRMTIRRFEGIVRGSGLRILHKNYHTIRNIPFVDRLPFLREFFIVEVVCVLAR
jgi:2-polyprenyl-3-methyl-5-hydroxy-6-metoxy-1,4-benzoquinol methylase